MTQSAPIAETLASLASLVQALDALEPSYFGRKLAQAGTARDYYDIVLELDYAANSKWLRDTGDERVHHILNDIGSVVDRIDGFFRIKLWPGSTAQNQSWTHAVLRAAGGKYAFRDDGSLEISLLDARLHGETLTVKRIWNHVCNYSGSLTEFEIRLDEQQIAEARARLASLRSFPLPL